MAKPNYKIIRECLILAGSVDKKAMLKLVSDTQKILKKEPNVIVREGSIAIIGDIHG